MTLVAPAGVKVLTIGELTRQIKTLMEQAHPSVWVSGEISNLSRPSSGHYYFSLKDAEAQLQTVLYRSTALRLRFEPRDGMEVIARGRMSVYVPRGNYQLLVDEMQPKGLGALELALRQLKEKLFRLGYFAPERKKPLPRFPRRVALVTSPTGAAVRDMLEILGRRWPLAEVWVCPVRVQGEGAGDEIAAALRRLNRLSGVDVIIAGRGGGSIEDLWAFNEECVAHAIYQSRVPVVSAVGHEIDFTIADLVADRRGLTPSEAAAAVTPDCQELLEGLRAARAQLRTLLLQRLELARDRLWNLAQRRALRAPVERVYDHERRLDDWSARLERAMRQHLARGRERVERQAAQLTGLSPLNVLARGYSLTRREADRAVVRDPAQVRVGDRLLTQIERGQIISRVEKVAGPTAPSAPASQG
jgi:exodeoxyribonuclease VII large subunit